MTWDRQDDMRGTQTQETNLTPVDSSLQSPVSCLQFLVSSLPQDDISSALRR